MDEGTHFVKVLNGVALAGCCSIDALSPGVFASLDPRLSAGNLSGCRFPAGPRWFRRPTTYGTRRMKFFARRANINCLHCGYARINTTRVNLYIRAYPRNPRFFFPFATLKTFAARKDFTGK